MTAGKARLGDVAPARPLKGRSVEGSRVVWQLNLDQVEAQSGRILEKQRATAEMASSSTHLFDSQHVLYSKLRPYLNKVVLPDELGVATTELVPMLPDPNRLDRKYLAYYLRSKFFVDWVSQQVAGAKMPRVSMKVFWDHEIPLPALDEQKRIATVLDKADALCRKRRQAIELADQFLRSVFLEKFGDPVRNPKGWPILELGSVAQCQLGKMLSQKAKAGLSPKKYLRNANVRWGSFDLSEVLEMDFSEREQVKFSLRPGDLLVCEGGEIGRCAIWNGELRECYFQKALHRIRVRDNLTSEYLQEYFYWMSRLGGFSKSVSQVTFSHLTSEKLKQLSVPIPPIALQDEFSDIFWRTEVHKNRLNEHCRELGSLFNSLSSDAFSA